MIGYQFMYEVAVLNLAWYHDNETGLVFDDSLILED